MTKDQDRHQCTWQGCTAFFKGSRPPEGWTLIGTATKVVVTCPDCERTFSMLAAQDHGLLKIAKSLVYREAEREAEARLKG